MILYIQTHDNCETIFFSTITMSSKLMIVAPQIVPLFMSCINIFLSGDEGCCWLFQHCLLKLRGVSVQWECKRPGFATAWSRNTWTMCQFVSLARKTIYQGFISASDRRQHVFGSFGWFIMLTLLWSLGQIDPCSLFIYIKNRIFFHITA